jgi:dienelactone hydrolase
VSRRTTIATLVGVAALALSVAAADSEHWAGRLDFRGDSWPVRLRLTTIPGTADALEAHLDLPDLVYAGQPVPARQASDGPAVELPFGIGEFLLSRGEDGNLSATRAIGEQSMTLQLQPAPAPLFRELPLVFDGAGVKLAGTLFLPAGPGPHPGVVLVQGSSAASRESWGLNSWGDTLARFGIATLIYDRRGSGESGTDTRSRDHHFADLAADAAAAVRRLSAQSEVDAGRVGMMGFSQGGWILPRAAAELPSLAFVVLSSTSAMTPGAQEILHRRTRMERAGLTPDEIAEAVAYLRLYFTVAETGRGWETLAGWIREAREEPWFEHIDDPRSPADLEWWREHQAFDPRPWLAQIEAPVLAHYGSRDDVVPPVPNAAMLKSALGAGSAELTLRVFPDADHRLETPMGKGADGVWRWPRLAPGVVEGLASWLRERGILDQ